MTTETSGNASAFSGQIDEQLIAAVPASLEELEGIVIDVGGSPWLWGHAVSFDLERPSHRVLYKTPHLEIALFGWAAGQDTTFHDHGGASGAAFVCSGLLIEETVNAVDGHIVAQHTHTRRAESVFSFGPDYIHRVRHDRDHGVALSIHAYTPADSDAVDYEVLPNGTLRAFGADRQLQPA